MNTEYHEQLSTGTAVVTEDDDYPTVRINPIGEGEITVGQSGEPTLWDRDALKAAVEQNALIDPELGVSEVVEGTGGRNPHHPMGEQVPPKAKLAQVPDWEYEDGVGPVADVQLADEDIARRVNLGLLDVSADLERELGEFDEELGARPVERILSMPRVTVVDRGASPSASIEPATAEALGYNPDTGAGGLEGRPGGENSEETAGADTPTDDTGDDDTMTDDKSKEELREQLAAAQAEVTEKEEQVEDLQSEKENLEETKEDLESTNEELESENEDLQENNETFQRALAQKYAEQSPMDAEKAMDRLEIDDMVEDLDPGPDDEDDDRSPKERLSEQLAAGVSLRGQNTEETGGGSVSDDDLENAEQLAESVLSLGDIQRINSEQLSKREYLQREHDVDPVEYGSEDSLRQAIEAEGGD